DLRPEQAQRQRENLVKFCLNPQTPYPGRRGALETIGSFRQYDSVREILRDAYTADDSGARASAIKGMGRSGASEWLESIMSELSSDDAEIRFEEAQAVGLLGDEPEVVVLARLDGDEDVENRQSAVVSLGRICGRAATRALGDVLKRAGDEERDWVEDALEDAMTLMEPATYSRYA
ncbi:MAG: hypothetical protein M3R06_08480, partial [Chloroflexota bacterium]|nr:hypothetical protein [Chloroflexota bacterium]